MAKRVLDTDWLGEPRIEPSPSKVNRKGRVGTAGPLRYLSYLIKLTHMEKIQVYLLSSTHCARWLHDRGVALQHLVRKVVLMPAVEGPIAIWDGEPKRSSLNHDSVHDEP